MSEQLYLKSVITCPHCGAKKEETMDENSCLFFYHCETCNKLLKPHEGDCCVFCSFGNINCPPVQKYNCCA